MSLYDRLLKEKNRLGKKALRFPKTNQELLDRKRWERVYTILTRRYEYGIEDVMEQYRWGDFRDEIAAERRQHGTSDNFFYRIRNTLDHRRTVVKDE